MVKAHDVAARSSAAYLSPPTDYPTCYVSSISLAGPQQLR